MCFFFVYQRDQITRTHTKKRKKNQVNRDIDLKPKEKRRERKKHRHSLTRKEKKKCQTIEFFLVICIASTYIMAITIWYTHTKQGNSHRIYKEAFVILGLFIYTDINIFTICREKER